MNQDERRQDPRYAHLKLNQLIADCSRRNGESRTKTRARAAYFFKLMFGTEISLHLQHHLGTLRGPKAKRLLILFQWLIFDRDVGFNAYIPQGHERISLAGRTYQNHLMLGQNLSIIHEDFDTWLAMATGGFEFEFGDEEIRIPTFEQAGEPGWEGQD